MLYFITGNSHKVETAKKELDKQAISFVSKDLNVTEIQSTSIENIAKAKAKEAFHQLKKPLFIKDDGWFITTLNGFPGAYMHYINKWLTSEDLLTMMKGKKNREIIFQEVVCYIDTPI